MNFINETIKCQDPKNNNNIVRDYKVVKVTVLKDSAKYNEILKD